MPRKPRAVEALALAFREGISLCNLGCLGTHTVDQVGLKLKNLPASASCVLELKACATTAGLRFIFICMCECLHVCMCITRMPGA